MKIGFIGFGKMGKAIGKSLKKKVVVFDPNLTENGIEMEKVESAKEAIEKSDCIILAVKPQVMEGLLKEISTMNVSTKEKTFISIAAGISTSKIEGFVEGNVVRAMPNICCSVQEGAIAISKGKKADDEALRKAIEIFEKTGKVFVVEERALDLITAYTGAAPAYIAKISKLFYESAHNYGLDETLSKELFIQTLKGTAKLMEEYDADKVMQMVATPGGVTEQGLKVLEEGKDLFNKVLEKGMSKSRELGK